MILVFYLVGFLFSFIPFCKGSLIDILYLRVLRCQALLIVLVFVIFMIWNVLIVHCMPGGVCWTLLCELCFL